MEEVRFAFVVHDHQPVGNFDSVFEQAYRDGYLPFLELLEAHPWFRITMHTSGPLLEWLIEHEPAYIERLCQLVRRGQVEILGGAYYEPILTMIPPHDRREQIVCYRRRLEEVFQTSVEGLWIAERVWEPSLVSDLADAGMRYTLLDDFHFRVAGLAEDALDGYFITEDAGKLLIVFPISERLRYLIPFRDPVETIDYCAHAGNRRAGAVLVFGDDGEKFGVWPETRKHVYEDRWLERFLAALQDNLDWLHPCTLREVVETLPPRGKVYLPDCSYREMTEWALPTDRGRILMDLEKELQHHPRWVDLRNFIRGGSWRNFKVKYPETNEMYCRMLEVSNRLQLSLAAAAANPPPPGGDGQPVPLDVLDKARDHLYRAQCNCAYWHGWFGGVYLPHLRHAVYENLIAAECLMDSLNNEHAPCDAASGDFNLDSLQEVRLENACLVVYVAPARGGHIYELDIKDRRFNLASVVSRRPEVYHDGLAERLAADNAPTYLVHPGSLGTAPQLVYDAWRRAIAVDHIVSRDTTLDAIAGNRFHDLLARPLGVYAAAVRRSRDAVECNMTRSATVDGGIVDIQKVIRLPANAPVLEFEYCFTPRKPGRNDLLFLPEFALAALAGHTPDRYLLRDGHIRTENLGQLIRWEGCRTVAIVDEYMNLCAQLELSTPADVVSVPLETLSQSEAGYERVFQGVILYPMFPLDLTAGPQQTVRIRLELRPVRAPGSPHLGVAGKTSSRTRT